MKTPFSSQKERTLGKSLLEKTQSILTELKNCTSAKKQRESLDLSPSQLEKSPPIESKKPKNSLFKVLKEKMKTTLSVKNQLKELFGLRKLKKDFQSSLLRAISENGEEKAFVVANAWFELFCFSLHKLDQSVDAENEKCIIKYIKNKSLVKKSSLTLRKGLKEMDDFVVLPQSIWILLKESFGCDYEIKIDYS